MRLRGFQRLPGKQRGPAASRAGSESGRRGPALRPPHRPESPRPFAHLVLSHLPEPSRCHLLQEATLTSLGPGWPRFLVPQANQACSRSRTGPRLGPHAESAPRTGPGPAATLEGVTRLSPQLPVRMTARHGCRGWTGSAGPERGGEAGRATRGDAVSRRPLRRERRPLEETDADPRTHRDTGWACHAPTWCPPSRSRAAACLRPTPVTRVPHLSPRPGGPLVGAASRRAPGATPGPEPAGPGREAPSLQMFRGMNILIFFLSETDSEFWLPKGLLITEKCPRQELIDRPSWPLLKDESAMGNGRRDVPGAGYL